MDKGNLTLQRDLPRRESLGIDPLAKRVKPFKNTSRTPYQRNRFGKASAVVEDIPKPREPFHLLNIAKAKEIVLEDVVGGSIAVDHPMTLVMAGEGSSREIFQYPDLDFAVGEGDEGI